MREGNNKIYLSGTNGLPGKYGGWDNLLLNLSKELSKRNIVFCHTSIFDGDPEITFYEGANIDFINLSANGFQSILYDFICMFRAFKGKGVCILMGCSGGIFVPLFRILGLKIILNPDGEEWKRGKWSIPAKIFLKISYYIATYFANFVVADHPVILKNILKFRSKKTTFYIPYGGDNAEEQAFDFAEKKVSEMFFKKSYIFSVCRIEPENNIHMCLALAAETNHPLIFIGNWNRSKYGLHLRKKYSKYSNICMLDPIYDPTILGSFRSNAKIYFHGHTVGGTNPSLVEAMYLGLNIIAHDNVFNRFTTGDLVYYFSNQKSLHEALSKSISQPISAEKLKNLVLERYTWKKVIDKYKKVLELTLR